MYLKQLELVGFKSFAKKTTLDFPEGITAIVGPNGSGKSNIADAVRWVLAERSFKNLRSQKGEDLIFYGSSARQALARASVAMTFDLGANPPPVDLAEVVLGREVEKNGDNIYRLNDRRVRLLDLEEFLARSRIGASSDFRVLSQGLSDMLLTLGPQEFREFIEEAAGVKEYQDKKYNAALKLRNTQENLKQVGAILAELSPRLKVLKREKDKLAKKEVYLAELKEVSRQLFGTRHHVMLAAENNLAEKKRTLNRQLRPLADETNSLRDELFSFEKKTALSQELGQLESKIRFLDAEDNRLAKEIILNQGKMAVEEERRRQKLPVTVDYLKEKISRLVGEISSGLASSDSGGLRSLLRSVHSGLSALLSEIKRGINTEKDAKATSLLKARLDELLAKRAGIRKNMAVLAQERQEKENFILEERKVTLTREKSYRQKEAELRNLENSLRELELAEEKLKLHREQFNNDLRNINIVTLADVLDYSVAPAAQRSGGEQELEEKLWKLKRRVEEIGLIDPEVIKEYDGVCSRFGFLSGESSDLESTLSSLGRMIKDLEHQIKGRYKNTLVDMSDAFNSYFRLVFGGGRASLMPTTINNSRQKVNLGNGLPRDPIEEGIAIKLELPNKKIKGLGTLSGGEQTLTSIALLFALVSVRRPPFLVLDEIDAALDETNTQKFMRLLKELAKQTQFIIITHNRETMRTADALYGVSMKDGISHLLSLKLEPASPYSSVGEPAGRPAKTILT